MLRFPLRSTFIHLSSLISACGSSHRHYISPDSSELLSSGYPPGAVVNLWRGLHAASVFSAIHIAQYPLYTGFQWHFAIVMWDAWFILRWYSLQFLHVTFLSPLQLLWRDDDCPRRCSFASFFLCLILSRRQGRVFAEESLSDIVVAAYADSLPNVLRMGWGLIRKDSQSWLVAFFVRPLRAVSLGPGASLVARTLSVTASSCRISCSEVALCTWL